MKKWQITRLRWIQFSDRLSPLLLNVIRAQCYLPTLYTPGGLISVASRERIISPDHTAGQCLSEPYIVAVFGIGSHEHCLLQYPYAIGVALRNFFYGQFIV